MIYIVSYFIGVSIVSFLLMGLDKRRAVNGDQRISERTLLLFAFIGGSVGIYFGMKQFRHKTKKPKFNLGIPVIIVGQVILLFFLYY
ncbi:DUF1294 domain-containing protein [Alkalihalobacterium chitinilyticum]|uniref:DUF1294 domain-containing protein n=1 Tax=Alkalihalobacterium chitinilyticum TaxID=2980103 RepID=A0ABT5VA68_9BACI|nr:DUF1294 domain-containing protein [Alkalihalobacterium chitinilyticum]MDE5412357.1 DUF1294 domain-containing protein [Alkalihalobacterium chitinilyticum]